MQVCRQTRRNFCIVIIANQLRVIYSKIPVRHGPEFKHVVILSWKCSRTSMTRAYYASRHACISFSFVCRSMAKWRKKNRRKRKVAKVFDADEDTTHWDRIETHDGLCLQWFFAETVGMSKSKIYTILFLYTKFKFFCFCYSSIYQNGTKEQISFNVLNPQQR